MFRIFTHYATFFVENWCCGILVQYYYTWMDSKLNEYYDDRKRESHRVRKRYFRSHPHLIISPKPRRKRLGRRKWPTQLLLLLCLRVCVEHSLLLELANRYNVYSETKIVVVYYISYSFLDMFVFPRLFARDFFV